MTLDIHVRPVSTASKSWLDWLAWVASKRPNRAPVRYKTGYLDLLRRSRRAHVTEEEKPGSCWCRPDVLENGTSYLVIHNDVLLVH